MSLAAGDREVALVQFALHARRSFRGLAVHVEGAQRSAGQGCFAGVPGERLYGLLLVLLVVLLWFLVLFLVLAAAAIAVVLTCNSLRPGAILRDFTRASTRSHGTMLTYQAGAREKTHPSQRVRLDQAVSLRPFRSEVR